jgi:hypothetical protein
MQTIVRLFQYIPPRVFMTQIINHSFKAGYDIINLTNCNNIPTLVWPASC